MNHKTTQPIETPLSETEAPLSETESQLSETETPLSKTETPLSETATPLSLPTFDLARKNIFFKILARKLFQNPFQYHSSVNSLSVLPSSQLSITLPSTPFSGGTE